MLKIAVINLYKLIITKRVMLNSVLGAFVKHNKNKNKINFYIFNILNIQVLR
jgi:NADH:ubiquinone oxidoreductase subunit K